jgi:hypothetical protein
VKTGKGVRIVAKRGADHPPRPPPSVNADKDIIYS